MSRHFEDSHTQPTRARGMGLKTLVLLTWFVTSYALLVFWVQSPFAALALCLSLGLAMAGIGFGIQHDGNHGAYSGSKGLNLLSGLSLDLLGGSSYLWRWKHNIFHHSHPNTVGRDTDIDLEPFCRLAPGHTRRAAHRYQHLYIWFLYALLAPKWQFLDDFLDLSRGHMAGQKFPRPRGADLAFFIGGKLFFVGWAFVLPALFHPVWVVLLGYVAAAGTLGFTLAVTFQLAHITEGAAFEAPPSGGSSEWAVHQAESALNFAPGNRLLTWYVGGLNHQIEHHLFPRVCHMHLRAISPIVRATCEEFGVAYQVRPTLGAALASHVRWIQFLGAPATVQPC